MKKPKPIKMWAIVMDGKIQTDVLTKYKKYCIEEYCRYYGFWEDFKGGTVKIIKVEVRAI